jgi:hypothetical protein
MQLPLFWKASHQSSTPSLMAPPSLGFKAAQFAEQGYGARLDCLRAALAQPRKF